MASQVPEDRRYTSEHEWALEEAGRVVVGITEYAQDQLGDVVFVQLPETGSEVRAGEPFGEVESTKSVSDVYSPVSGTVADKNSSVEDSPEVINSDPYGDGWLIKIDPSDPGLDDLLSAEDYRRLIEGEEGS